MDTAPTGFNEVALYLKHPLVLVGFVVALAIAALRAIIPTGIIPELSKTDGSSAVQHFLRYTFLIALATIILGFGLRYFEMYRDHSQVSESPPSQSGTSAAPDSRSVPLGGKERSGEKRKVLKVDSFPRAEAPNILGAESRRVPPEKSEEPVTGVLRLEAKKNGKPYIIRRINGAH